MNILIDTHILIWWLENPQKINTQARSIIKNGKNTVFVSTAVAWEIAIKKSLGKLEAPYNLEETLILNRFILPITFTHALMVTELPLYHGDPFDRIQIAQATMGKLRIITKDQLFNNYDVPIIKG